jgi:hypothetical protein
LANNDINLLYQNNTAIGNVLTNDFDRDNQALSANTTPIVAPLHGTITLNVDGSYSYVPIQDFIGKDYFSYQVCDAGVPSLCDTATVAICVTENVENISDVLPLASNDNFLIPFVPRTFDFNIVSNDLPEVGDSVVHPVLLSLQGVKGIVSIDNQGIMHYTPPANFVSEEVFQYYIQSHGALVKYDTATVTIHLYQFDSGNYPPIAVDDALLVPINTPTNGNVSSNDFDIDLNDTLTYAQMSNPSHGTIQLAADGSFVYTPDNAFKGVDQFTYKVCDNGNPQQCSEATVYLLIQQLKTECKVKICAPVLIKRRTK